MKKATNDFDSFLNECQTYVWEWYIPEQKVRFGIPSLNSLWLDDPDKNIKLATMLERVHPDDIQKVLVRHTSPLYRSDKMFEVDLRLNVASELLPDGESESGRYEWYGFRGKTVKRDKQGRPTYVRGVAINLDRRFRAQQKLLAQKDRNLSNERQKVVYCASVMQEVRTFIHHLAQNANSIIADHGMVAHEERLVRLNELKEQVSHILELSDRFGQSLGDRQTDEMREVRSLTLWEHMAEFQQRLALKLPPTQRLYFSNLYDDCCMWVNVDILDSLLESLVLNLAARSGEGTLILHYDRQDRDIAFVVTYEAVAETQNAEGESASSRAASELTLSVSRLMAKRLWGDIQMRSPQPGRWECELTLPLDARASQEMPAMTPLSVLDETDDWDDLSATEEGEEENTLYHLRRTSLPQVLIGLQMGNELYENQHLFEVIQAHTTDAVWQSFIDASPDIVFLQESLDGQLSVEEVVRRIHAQDVMTPIVVCADYASRPLHKQVRQWGARYLINNPLSLRKVNVMVKKFLK